MERGNGATSQMRDRDFETALEGYEYRWKGTAGCAEGRCRPRDETTYLPRGLGGTLAEQPTNGGRRAVDDDVEKLGAKDGSKGWLLAVPPVAREPY